MYQVCLGYKRSSLTCNFLVAFFYYVILWWTNVLQIVYLANCIFLLITWANLNISLHSKTFCKHHLAPGTSLPEHCHRCNSRNCVIDPCLLHLYFSAFPFFFICYYTGFHCALCSYCFVTFTAFNIQCFTSEIAFSAFI